MRDRPVMAAVRLASLGIRLGTPWQCGNRNLDVKVSGGDRGRRRVVRTGTIAEKREGRRAAAPRKSLLELAGSTGIEPATSGLTVQCANQAAPRARNENASLYHAASQPVYPATAARRGAHSRLAVQVSCAG